MKKFLVSMIAVFAATSAFAADPIFGAKPPVKKSGVGFTSQSVGVQMQDNKFFVNYANDGKDWFTITNPGKDVPNVENYAGGLFKGTRFVSVLTLQLWVKYSQLVLVVDPSATSIFQTTGLGVFVLDLMFLS
jgi:hypothetical protein